MYNLHNTNYSIRYHIWRGHSGPRTGPTCSTKPYSVQAGYRKITVENLDVIGREAIFSVHLPKIKIDGDSSVFAKKLANLTHGFAGAHIANVCNEAALIAARLEAESVTMKHFENAVDRVVCGLEKKDKVINKAERKINVYHEAGHAVMGWFLNHSEPPLKVTITPRKTQLLGFTQNSKESSLMTKEQLLDMTCMTLGGRASEEVMLGTISTGAHDDLAKVTKWTYAQVTIYGFSSKIGLVSFPKNENGYDFIKPYSSTTNNIIDEEMRDLVQKAYQRTLEVVKKHKYDIVKVAELLMEKETVNREMLVEVLGQRGFELDN
ncbi:hypothetical protein LUZ60_011357 [Juncus effusus]|nr:hypothetical protein LUZ60_011357 [Juncus effusus]